MVDKIPFQVKWEFSRFFKKFKVPSNGTRNESFLHIDSLRHSTSSNIEYFMSYFTLYIILIL